MITQVDRSVKVIDLSRHWKDIIGRGIAVMELLFGPVPTEAADLETKKEILAKYHTQNNLKAQKVVASL